MKLLTILVDLDGIVADTMPAWLQRIYEITGVQASLDDIDDWVIAQCPPLDQIEPAVINDIVDEEGFTLNLPIFDGASENLRMLREAGHRIYFVTARWGNHCMRETIPWLKKNIPWCNPELDLMFAHDKFSIEGDVLIDDKISNLQLYRKYHPDAHLLTIDYNYNRCDDIGVFRVPYGKDAWKLFRKHIEAVASNKH